MSEPTTLQASALIEEWYPGGGDGLDADELAAFRSALAAIEAEAREQERALADELAELLAEGSEYGEWSHRHCDQTPDGVHYLDHYGWKEDSHVVLKKWEASHEPD